ncbi:jg25907 [Pararge aegeria aegeria]|uniref:Jg25907 protein n=1 Tax=Pararge aegeria aegeria TaxID=348720 RepID=A0A8S4QGS3_9NEOP|nr:jg25907 [Pararge aegeria aegeria]
MRLRLALMPHHPLLADHVARTTLRLSKPQCDLESSWEEEDLTKATIRTINLVYAETAAVGKDAGDNPHRVSHLTAPGFCYVFPLLKQGLTSSTARGNEAMMVNGLAVISQHAALRGQTQDLFAPDQLHPQLFPIDQMFRLLIDLIGNCLLSCKKLSTKN